MNVKILIKPLIIVVSLVLFIWLVYPAYSNGSDGLKEKMENLKNEQEKLEKIKDKGQKAEMLYSQISSLASEKDILYKFIPDNMQEEKIVDNLNYLATNEGLLVYEITVNQPKKESLDQFALVQFTDENLAGSLGTDVSAISLPKMQDLEVEMKVAGSYEKIRNFLANVGKMERCNDFKIMNIGKNQPGGNQLVDPSFLTVDMNINFAILKAVKIADVSGANDPIFSTPQLDSSIIPSIKGKRTASNFEIIVDQKGKANPFTP